MRAYDDAGKRNSSKTHARRGHECEFCGKWVFGNGGKVAHARTHVRAGEVVEYVRWNGYDSTNRVFIAPDSEQEAGWIARGFRKVEA